MISRAEFDALDMRRKDNYIDLLGEGRKTNAKIDAILRHLGLELQDRDHLNKFELVKDSINPYKSRATK